MSETANTPTLVNDAAWKRLEELEAEQSKDTVDFKPELKTDDTIQADDRALAGEEVVSQEPSKKSSDTLSDAENNEVVTAKAEAEKEGKELEFDEKGIAKRGEDGKFVKLDKKTVEQPIEFNAEERAKFDKYLAQKQGSKYSKDFNRRMVTWSELNSEKEKFSAAKVQQENQYKAAIAKFNADVQAFQEEKSSMTPSPEKYEAFADKQNNLANEKELAAKKAEEAGDFDTAEKLRDEAKFARRDATAAKASAENVRKNPPINEKQRQEKFVADQRTWLDKAAIDFPEFAKKDSDLQKSALEYFKQITSSDPVVAKLPGFVYFCAERAALKSASDSVPAMTKELGDLRTKVKDLEALTNPTPSAGISKTPSVKTWDSMSSDEQYDHLRQEALSSRR